MPFEDDLRQRLQQDAAAIPLPTRRPAQATQRARRRHRRNLAAVGVVGVAALVGVALIAPHDSHDPQQVTAAAGTGGTAVLQAGPLTLDWKHASGGLSAGGLASPAAQAADGSIFALSTAPGVRSADFQGDTPMPKALYRLADDGTWKAVALDGARPRATGIAAGGDALYAVSTGPGTGGHNATVLSTSGDQGDTWASQSIAPAPDPSTNVKWYRSASAAIASNGGTTIALVTTSFFPDQAAIFPELQAGAGLTVEQRADGLALVRVPESTKEAQEAARKEKEAAASGATVPPSTGAPDPSPTTMATGATVRTVPWSQLGVSGPADFAARTSLFRRSGTAWAPVEAPGALAGIEGVQLQASGAGFVATGWSGPTSRAVVATSPDGVTWRALALPVDGQVYAVGSALVEVPWEGVVLKVSSDQGGSWQSVDLVDHGVAPGSWLGGSSSGALGFATVATPKEQGGAPLLITTGDLAEWAVGPVSEITGSPVVQASTLVTADRVVVSAQTTLGSSTDPARTVTAVGTPVRSR